MRGTIAVAAVLTMAALGILTQPFTEQASALIDYPPERVTATWNYLPSDPDFRTCVPIHVVLHVWNVGALAGTSNSVDYGRGTIRLNTGGKCKDGKQIRRWTYSTVSGTFSGGPTGTFRFPLPKIWGGGTGEIKFDNQVATSNLFGDAPVYPFDAFSSSQPEGTPGAGAAAGTPGATTGATSGGGEQEVPGSSRSGGSPVGLIAGIATALIGAGLIAAGVAAGAARSAAAVPSDPALTPESVDATDADEEDDAGSSDEDEDDEEDRAILLSFTFPAGPSPKIFMTGWLFGARAVASSGGAGEQDISDSVEWSGTGTFEPPTGAHSRPAFASEGSNTITIKVEYEGKVAIQNLVVDAVSPAGYAHVGSKAYAAFDAHGCPACPHTVQGLVLSGSPTVMVGGRPAARQGDPGRHSGTIDVGRIEREHSEMAIKNILEDRWMTDSKNYELGKGYSTTLCCGENIFTISGGDPQVIIDGRPAARIGDETNHCGGFGTITS